MATYTSKAFVYLGKPRAVRRDVIAVECGPRDLVVRVSMCARCGTDRTIYYHGHPNVDPYAPVVLGHELVARVIEVGSEVGSLREGIGYRGGHQLTGEYLDFRPGERLVFQSRIARYRNGLMLIPQPIANLSFQIDGGYAEYMRVPETMIRSESVMRVPDSVTDEEACLVEPAACALESIFATPHAIGVDEDGRHIFRSGVLPGGATCIIGSGTVSLIYAALAVLEGAARVVVLVRSETKAQQVRDLLGASVEVCLIPRLAEDASEATLAAESEIVRQLTDLTDGHLFDDVVVASASPEAQRLMLRLYTREGYAVGACFGGTHQLVDAADLDIHHYRAATTIGTSGCSTDCMKSILGWLQSGRLRLRNFTSQQQFTLDDDPHEFLTTDAGGLKPVVCMTEGDR